MDAVETRCLLVHQLSFEGQLGVDVGLLETLGPGCVLAEHSWSTAAVESRLGSTHRVSAVASLGVIGTTPHLFLGAEH